MASGSESGIGTIANMKLMTYDVDLEKTVTQPYTDTCPEGHNPAIRELNLGENKYWGA